MPSKSTKDLFLLLILFAGFLAFASCASKGQECYEPILVRSNNGFLLRDTLRVIYQVDSNTNKDSLTIVYRDSLMPAAEMKVMDEDTFFTLIGTELNSHMMRIALDPSRDSIRYAFRADTLATVRDTLTFYYTPIVHFVSNSCGYNYYYTLNNVQFTRNLFDSVVVLNNNVTNAVSVRNVQFYFKRQF